MAQQKLLDKEKLQKKLKRKQQANTLSKQEAMLAEKQAQLQALQQEQTQEEEKPKSKIWLFIFATLAIFAAFLPYPKLVTYESLKIVSSSVYIPGRFGLSQDHFIDTYGQVEIDEENNWLHICHQVGKKQNCQRYNIVKQEGLFSVLSHLMK